MLKRKIETKDYKSILVIITGFLVLDYFSSSDVFYYVAVGVGIFALSSTFMCKLILWVWEKIGFVLGWINTRILLTAVYVVILVPLALIRNLVSKKTRTSNTLFISRNKKYTSSDLINKW